MKGKTQKAKQYDKKKKNHYKGILKTVKKHSILKKGKILTQLRSH